MKNSLTAGFIFSSVLLSTLSQLSFADQHLSREQQRMSVDERNTVYAPWDPKDINKLRKEVGLIGPGPQTPYPTARFPGYLTTPESIEQLMPQAEFAVQQKGGRTPLGLADPGDIVLIPIPYTADPLVQEAIIKAFKARRVEARLLYEHEIAGVSLEDLQKIDKIQNVFKAGDGQQELNFLNMTGNISNWDDAVEWTRQHDNVLADATWPVFAYPDKQLEELAKNYNQIVDSAIVKYLDDHPEVNKVFWRTLGRAIAKKDLEHHGSKLSGNYTYINSFDIMSEVPAYPSDVWRLIESKMVEPVPYLDRVEVSDPEGSAFSFDLTSEQAINWSKGSYSRGHMFMFPSQASGIFPSSSIQYAKRDNQWLAPVQITTVNGIIASSNSHASNHPRIEIHVKNGYVDKVIGGGLYGDGFRLWLNYPRINELTWPYQKKPGFWWLFEAGTGTNPKYFKHPGEVLLGQNLSERNAGGVIHWSFGAEVKKGPDDNKEDGARPPSSVSFGQDHALPIGHAMHNHTLLPTYQIRLRESGNWQTLIEHGQIMASLDPEIRALASRYGNPEEILQRDWIPELPGITTPGNYDKDYSSNPGKFWKNWANSILNGTNKYIIDNQK